MKISLGSVRVTISIHGSFFAFALGFRRVALRCESKQLSELLAGEKLFSYPHRLLPLYSSWLLISDSHERLLDYLAAATSAPLVRKIFTIWFRRYGNNKFRRSSERAIIKSSLLLDSLSFVANVFCSVMIYDYTLPSSPTFYNGNEK